MRSSHAGLALAIVILTRAPPLAPAYTMLQVFVLSKLPLEEYAFSLGLAAQPRMPGLAQALEKSLSARGAKAGGASGEEGGAAVQDGEADNEKQREEARAKKNVNRSLQRLKEQIKADKLRKRMEVRS